MLKKLSEFWKQNKKAIVTVASLTVAAPYLPVLVPLADIAADAAVQTEPATQPGQSQGEGK